MDKNSEYFKPLITSLDIAKEIIDGMPETKTKETFQTIYNACVAEGKQGDWEILQDRLAGWLVSNQPKTF